MATPASTARKNTIHGTSKTTYTVKITRPTGNARKFNKAEEKERSQYEQHRLNGRQRGETTTNNTTQTIASQKHKQKHS